MKLMACKFSTSVILFYHSSAVLFRGGEIKGLSM
jgi:hypothetical protein